MIIFSFFKKISLISFCSLAFVSAWANCPIIFKSYDNNFDYLKIGNASIYAPMGIGNIQASICLKKHKSNHLLTKVIYDDNLTPIKEFSLTELQNEGKVLIAHKDIFSVARLLTRRSDLVKLKFLGYNQAEDELTFEFIFNHDMRKFAACYDQHSLTFRLKGNNLTYTVINNQYINFNHIQISIGANLKFNNINLDLDKVSKGAYLSHDDFPIWNEN